ncbi:hypothetical protein A5760_11615 [Mycobacterium colombiense]|uniref:Uncharacterized protein n=1 Tax=Mycobacterium colombiense TaxID=339268 RepID=A0A1A0VI44_9MYCO|nr:hypothetical protein A5760_11615 [Mycobacterium colombiense]
MQQGFDLLQLCFPSLLGVEKGVEKTAFPNVFGQPSPGRRVPLGIDGTPDREKVTHAGRHADSALEDTLVRVQPRVEDARHLVSDRITEKVFELASRVLFELDDQPVDDLHSYLDALLTGPGFTPQVVQNAIDVIGNLLDLVERVTLDDQHQVVAQIGQRPQPVQQVSNMVMSLIHLIGEIVEVRRQLPGHIADLR